MEPKVGDLVFARVKGYRAWPAKIQKISSPGKYYVFFYGTYQYGVVKKQDVWLFDTVTIEKWGKKGKNKIFDKALNEIEQTPEISEDPPIFIPSSAKKSSPKVEKTPKRAKNHGPLMYVQVKGTDEVIEIDCHRNKPKNFKNLQEAKQWEANNMKKIYRFVKLVKEGKFVPNEIITKLQNKEDKTDDEIRFLARWKYLQVRVNKITV